MKLMRGRSVLRRSAGPGISFQLCRSSHFLDTSKVEFRQFVSAVGAVLAACCVFLGSAGRSGS